MGASLPHRADLRGADPHGIAGTQPDEHQDESGRLLTQPLAAGPPFPCSRHDQPPLDQLMRPAAAHAPRGTAGCDAAARERAAGRPCASHQAAGGHVPGRTPRSACRHASRSSSCPRNLSPNREVRGARSVRWPRAVGQGEKECCHSTPRGRLPGTVRYGAGRAGPSLQLVPYRMGSRTVGGGSREPRSGTLPIGTRPTALGDMRQHHRKVYHDGAPAAASGGRSPMRGLGRRGRWPHRRRPPRPPPPAAPRRRAPTREMKQLS